MTLLEYINYYYGDGGEIVEAFWRGLTSEQTSKVLGLDPILIANVYKQLEKEGF